MSQFRNPVPIIVLLCLIIAVQCFAIVGCHLRSHRVNADYHQLAEGAARVRFFELKRDLYDEGKRDPSRKFDISFSDFRLKYEKLSYAADTMIAHHYLWKYTGKRDLGERNEISVTIVPAQDDDVYAVFGNHWR